MSRELFEEDSQTQSIKKRGRIPESEKKRPGRKPNPDVLRKRLMTLYKCVFDYNVSSLYIYLALLSFTGDYKKRINMTSVISHCTMTPSTVRA